ncbi:MAG: hypothetical protein NUV86_12160 [Candidatus Scalindua sp.]|nr:hypothetical protein [Candidatus Scalindua sp.]
MKVISAKVLDSTHLELSQPITLQPGINIEISIPDENEDDKRWKKLAKKRFFESYDEQDSIYDNI